MYYRTTGLSYDNYLIAIEIEIDLLREAYAAGDVTFDAVLEAEAGLRDVQEDFLPPAMTRDAE